MSGLRIVLQLLVGPLVFFAGMVACMTIGEPLASGVGLTWRNVVAMCAIPWLCGYTGYHMGWLNGHYAGWIQARDEHRPNKLINLTRANSPRRLSARYTDRR
jgi:hypothetical protein